MGRPLRVAAVASGGRAKSIWNASRQGQMREARASLRAIGGTCRVIAG